jgi:ribosomal protein S18 acetylase RimI-like enzyme
MTDGTDYKVIARQQMDENELAKVRELEAVCNGQEGLTLKLNWGMLRERASGSGGINDFLCCGKDEKLVGFLALYGFGRSEMEVSGMVRPEFRQKGVFSLMLEKAGEECKQRDIKSFLFICERRSASGSAFIKARGASFDHSEHWMERPGSMEPIPLSSPVELREAVPGDYERLAGLDSICFDIPLEESRNFYTSQSFLSSEQLFVVELDGSDIGMVKLHKEDDSVFIFGFGIQPEFRGKGYGRAALARAVNRALDSRPSLVALEVDCVNDTALNLYKSCGFQTVTTYDYYRLPL